MLNKLAILSLGLALAGCNETSQTYVTCPDGVTIEAIGDKNDLTLHFSGPPGEIGKYVELHRLSDGFEINITANRHDCPEMVKGGPFTEWALPDSPLS